MYQEYKESFIRVSIALKPDTSNLSRRFAAVFLDDSNLGGE
jgi:hypothetical protein